MKTTSIKNNVLQNLTVGQSTNSASYGTPATNNGVQNGLSLIPLQKQTDVVHTLPLHFCTICFNIIFHLCPDLSFSPLQFTPMQEVLYRQIFSPCKLYYTI